MSTRTRFEKEAKGNSEMAYSLLNEKEIKLLLKSWLKTKSDQCKIHILSQAQKTKNFSVITN